MEKEAFVLETQGGIGNQLFQYAAALSIARRKSAPLLIDRWRHELPGGRPFQLSDIVDERFVTKTHHNILGASGTRGKVMRRAFRVAARNGLVRGTYWSRCIGFDRQAYEVAPPTRLVGYFQSWKYFDNSTEEIFARLNALSASVAPLNQSADQVDSNEGSVGMHVRLGDYLSPHVRRIHPPLPAAYYEAALSRLRDEGFGPDLLVFTDDEVEVLKLLRRIRHSFNPRIESQATSPLQTLLRLSRSTALITANSTFSWWGAWLASRRGVTVIAPRVWGKYWRQSDQTLLKPGWITL
mgnify:CR=1 FL=1